MKKNKAGLKRRRISLVKEVARLSRVVARLTERLDEPVNVRGHVTTSEPDFRWDPSGDVG